MPISLPVKSVSYFGVFLVCLFSHKCFFSLNVNANCVGGVWQVAGLDLLVPVNVLVDFCVSTVSIRGNFYVPVSSNVSFFRFARNVDVNGTQFGGQVRTGGAVSNNGWTLLVVSNTSSVQAPPPPTGTIYDNLYVVNVASPTSVPWFFQMSNKTQFWRNRLPGIACQTTTTYPIIKAPINSTTASWSVQAAFFNQCQNDWVIFVGVVAGVGGAIILATIVYAIVIIATNIHKSMNTIPTGPQYRCVCDSGNV
jgi:hypothetical protein